MNADALVGHFVTEARDAGVSWTAIGDRLGVSKQAVRERFADRATLAGRERFTPRVQRCVAAAVLLAQRCGSHEITPAHLIVALAANEGVAANALHRLGVTTENLSRAVAMGDPKDSPVASAPRESETFTFALRSAVAFATERGDAYVGTEHVLFVLVTDPGSSVRRLLEDLGADIADVKRELARCIGRGDRRRRRQRHTLGCSFCGTRDARLRGPGVGVCADCARLALELK